eukprot:8262038-Alexandrium_andersonii.AAC.1
MLQISQTLLKNAEPSPMPAARVRAPAQTGVEPVPMEGAGLPVAGAGLPPASGIPPPMTPPAMRAATAPA